MKIYVASSWRNNHQQDVVRALRAHGHDVYDYRNPAPGDHGFAWSEIDPDWKSWTPERMIAALNHPASERGFANDMYALESCDACVLVGPCGRSAHLELGYAVGAGKHTAVLLAQEEPELMYKMCGALFVALDPLIAWANRLHRLARLPASMVRESGTTGG